MTHKDTHQLEFGYANESPKPQDSESFKETIIVRGARMHNLKNVDIDIPRNKLTVITGLSGSGKSSLAFDTIFAEGQRRYVESLSAYARQFLNMMEKPDVDLVDGLSPAISIEQKTASRNPRSTVGTVTEIYDYLRLLYAKVATPFCYNCGKEVKKQTRDQIIEAIVKKGAKIQILAPVVRGRKGHYQELFEKLRKSGFVRVRIDGEIKELESVDKVSRYHIHNIEVVVDRIELDDKPNQRLIDSVEQALELGEGILIVHSSGKDITYSQHLACLSCGISYEEPFPKAFSFNSPYGACPSCEGLGVIREIDDDLIVPDKTKSVNDGAIAAYDNPKTETWFYLQMKKILEQQGFDFDTPIQKISKKAMEVLMNGTGTTKHAFYYYSANKKKKNYTGKYKGVKGMLKHYFDGTSSDQIREWAERFMSEKVCPGCNGGRLKKEALSYKLVDKNIHDAVTMSVGSAVEFFSKFKFKSTITRIGDPILKEINERLGFLMKVGLEYLTLDRSARTLSGGESQRIRLATQVGSQLVGVLYILDEPSIGLHQRDNQKLIHALKDLRDLGNTVLVVEHDRETMEHADYLVDLGPGAGRLGGEIVAVGHPKDFAKFHTVTAGYLNDERRIDVPKVRREGNGKKIILKGASGNNLKTVDLEIPLGKLIGITGVSGSGKSTLINETFYRILARYFYRATDVPLAHKSIKGLEFIDKVIDIDQSPIGRTPRSNPATYTNLFSLIRDLYAGLQESKVRGYKVGRFSFNVTGGRCEECQGAGLKKIEMNFLPDVYVLCETCSGKRYNRETLEVTYKNKNISEVLEMTVAEALDFFEAIPTIKRKIQTLHDVGLDYIHLGQQATTLSGGEAQRVKLAEELSKSSTGNTLYILDEPTTGLHFEDIKMLMNVLGQLVDKGNTVIVIEHNMDVVKCMDWIVDLGPEGGNGGGQIIAQGTPEDIARVRDSYTGKYLKPELARYQ